MENIKRSSQKFPRVVRQSQGGECFPCLPKRNPVHACMRAAYVTTIVSYFHARMGAMKCTASENLFSTDNY